MRDGGAKSHEPRGFVCLAFLAVDGAPGDGWTAGRKGTFSTAADSAPGSRGVVGQASYPAGFPGGEQPFILTRQLPPASSLYLSFWVKLSPDFQGHPSSAVNKILHIWIAGKNRVYLSANGRGDGPLEPQVRLQRIASDGGYRNLAPNFMSRAVVRGRWQHWEVLLRANNGGLNDGQVSWWVDGVPVGAYGGLAFVSREEPHWWESVSWAPTWGGMGDRVNREQYMRLARLYVSGAGFPRETAGAFGRADSTLSGR